MALNELSELKQERLDADQIAAELRDSMDDELVAKERLLADRAGELRDARREISALTEAVAREVSKRVTISVEEEEAKSATPSKQAPHCPWPFPQQACTTPTATLSAPKIHRSCSFANRLVD